MWSLIYRIKSGRTFDVWVWEKLIYKLWLICRIVQIVDKKYGDHSCGLFNWFIPVRNNRHIILIVGCLNGKQTPETFDSFLIRKGDIHTENNCSAGKETVLKILYLEMNRLTLWTFDNLNSNIHSFADWLTMPKPNALALLSYNNIENEIYKCRLKGS